MQPRFPRGKRARTSVRPCRLRTIDATRRVPQGDRQTHGPSFGGSTQRYFWKFIRVNCVQNGDVLQRPCSGWSTPVSLEQRGTAGTPNLKQATTALRLALTEAL